MFLRNVACSLIVGFFLGLLLTLKMGAACSSETSPACISLGLLLTLKRGHHVPPKRRLLAYCWFLSWITLDSEDGGVSIFLRNVVSFHLAGFSLGFLFYAEAGSQYVPSKRRLLASR
jgi:hypothetical protein